MGSFWHYARMMLRYRWRLVGALLMAFVSAGSLGAGLLALVPVMENILGERAAALPDLAADLSARLSAVTGGALALPEAFVEGLPVGRFRAVLWIVAGLGALTLLGAAANFAHAMLSITVATRTLGDIRQAVFDRLLLLPLGTVTAGHGADMISRALSDTNTLGRAFQSLTNKAVAQISKGIAALGAAFVIDWRLSLTMLVVAPLVAVIIRKTGKVIRRASRAAMRGQGRLLGIASETMQGFRVIKAHRTEGHASERFGEQNEVVVREMLRARTARALASPLVELVAILILGGFAIVAAKAIIDGELAPESFLMSLAALGVAGQSIKPLNAVVQDVQAATAAAQRVGEIMGAPAESPGAGAELPRHGASIEFEGVTFRYPGAADDALRGVSLRIGHGETVAFVGANGSGKTTLLSLVPRLYEPGEGRVLIDGVDVAGVTLDSLRGQIGVVTQETTLFRGTVASNIGYGLTGGAGLRERVERAGREAHADAFVAELPGGYDEPVGDQGLTLSGGQRQRLAIARAIVRDPAILIMDEATSMVDAESERLISDAIARFARDRTCLIVAHRLSTVLGADRIVVMDGGRVADSGTHDELLERCGAYRTLASAQLRGAASGAG